jgi:hypothetical protein
VEKTKHTHTHSLSLSLSLCLSKRNCNYQKAQKIQIHTTHSFSLFASEFNSMLVESRFCFYYRCQQPKKVQQKKRDLEQCSRARHDASRRDRQTDRKKKRLDDSQEMPSSVMSAILQVHDITFTVTSSMIRTCKESKGKQHHKRLVAVIIGLLVICHSQLASSKSSAHNLLHQAWQGQQWWRGYYYSSCHYNSNFISYCCCCCIINQPVVAVQFISQSVVAHLLQIIEKNEQTESCCGKEEQKRGGEKNHTHTHTHTFHSGEPFPVLAACSISCRRPASIKQAQKSLLQLLSKSPCVLLPAATGGREAGRGGFFFFLPSQVVPPFILCIGGGNVLLVVVVVQAGGGEGRGGQETYGLVMSGGRCEILQRHVKKNPTGSCLLLLLLPLSLLPSLTACLSCFHAHGLTHRLSRKNGCFPSRVLSVSHARVLSSLSVCVCLRSVHACVFFFCGFAVATMAKGPFGIPTPLGSERISRLPEEENKSNSFRASERASEDGSPSYLLKLMTTTTTTSWLLSLCVCICLPRNLIE